MAHLEAARRVTSAAQAVARLGSSLNASRTSVNIKPSKINTKDDLCQSFRQLGISPSEAHLSASAVASKGLLLSPLHHTQTFQLPSLVNPVSISVPSLYSGAALEKEMPSVLNILEKIDPLTKNEVQEAPSGQVIEKQAARLIVIRRRKMKRHKLRKLRKKMKFAWAKVRQKREYRKEKLFQATEMAKVREYEKFDAVKYVEDFLQQTKVKEVTHFWKGSRLPKAVIVQLTEEEAIKKKKKLEHHLGIQRMKKKLNLL